jgi:wyosine [tRNA(Phe)-imidazoG37] synthetase (radical SAM superfamily)
MATFLFEEIVFGPVKSRRLGVSLGINLLPVDAKVCSFDCVYCECGTNKEHRGGKLPNSSEVLNALESKLKEMQSNHEAPDVITFAGNGEPTLHPEFATIIDETLRLRDAYFPKANVSVLSNATQLGSPRVFEALKRVDQAILKLDSAHPKTIALLDRPVSSAFNVEKLVEQLKAFNGKLIVQTLFTRGQYGGQHFDNTTEEEIADWIGLLRQIRPESVMIYTIDRDTPIQHIEKIPLEALQQIAKRVEDEAHISVSVAG